MRFILSLVLVLGAGATAAFAADSALAKEAATDGKAFNTMCGKDVDAKIAPIAAKTTADKDVMIGCCSESCAPR